MPIRLLFSFPEFGVSNRLQSFGALKIYVYLGLFMFIYVYLCLFYGLTIKLDGQDHSVPHPGSKVKVKCTLVQALMLCTGRTAHRGSRGIALLFHDQRH
jgi:hypothetical protein